MVRKSIELALAAGERRWSEQTKFVHHYESADPDEVHYTILVLQNFLYAAALMGTRQAEQVQKATDLLERLMPYQNSEGLFPVYLHHYPACHDRYIGMRLIPVAQYICREFGHVIPRTLKSKLEKIALDGTPLRVACCRGEEPQVELTNEIYVPQQLGEIYLYLRMVYPSLSESPWKWLWEHIQNNWNHQIHRFVGPIHQAFQRGFEPETTLLDLIMADATGVYPQSVLEDHPIHLYGAIIPELKDPLTLNEEKVSISFASDAKQAKGFYPFLMQWGSAGRAHSFALQGVDGIQGMQEGDKIKLKIPLNEESPGEDRDKQREVKFFFDVQDVDIRIKDIPATTFEVGDPITLQFKEHTLKLRFSLEGEGTFLGHIARSNRPAQVKAKGSRRFDAYDWTLFLRTIKREVPCEMAVDIEVVK